MKRILVTGSEGLIGKELVEILSKDKNNEIIRADIRFGYNLRIFGTCTWLCNGVDEVYNCVGIKGSPKRTSENPLDFFVPTVQFNTNMIEAAREKGVKKFLYVSSIAVEHMETDFYPAWAKLTGEKQIEATRIQFKDNCTKYCIVRPANIYGRYDNFDNPHAMVITSLVNKSLLDSDYLEVWGDGTQERDFVNAKDAAEAMIKCMELMPEEPINICSGKGITIKRVAEILALRTGKKIIFDTTKPIGAQSRVMRFDGDKIKWEPKISIEEGIDLIFKELSKK